MIIPSTLSKIEEHVMNIDLFKKYSQRYFVPISRLICGKIAHNRSINRSNRSKLVDINMINHTEISDMNRGKLR